MKLHREIGLNLSGTTYSSSFGISARKVELRDGSSQWRVLDSSTTSQTSVLIMSQKEWKKVVVKPSGPGALPSFSWDIAESTSCVEICFRRSSLCSSVMSLGTCWVILSIVGPLFVFYSWCTSLKCVRNSFSISSCCSILVPSWFWVALLFCERTWCSSLPLLATWFEISTSIISLLASAFIQVVCGYFALPSECPLCDLL